MRWGLCLSEYDFEVHYKKCINNSEADCMSRVTTESGATGKIEKEICRFATEEHDEVAAEVED